MSRLLTAILVLLASAMMLSDPLFCPDGCTNADALAHPTASSACALCQSGMAVDPPPALAGRLSPTSFAPATDIAPFPAAPVRSIDHPPRRA